MKNLLKSDLEIITFCDLLRNKLIAQGVDLDKNKVPFAFFLCSTVAELREDSGFIYLFCDSPKEIRLRDGLSKVLSAGVRFSSVFYDHEGISSEDAIVDKGLEVIKTGNLNAKPCLFEFLYSHEWVIVEEYMELKDWDCTWQEMKEICAEVISQYNI